MIYTHAHTCTHTHEHIYNPKTEKGWEVVKGK